MTIDFDAMAVAAAAENKYKEAAEITKRKQEQEDSETLSRACVDLLTRDVMPIIQRAKNAFTRNGVIFEVSTEFKNEYYTVLEPNIKVQIKQLAPGRNDKYHISGRLGFFSCSDAKNVLGRINKKNGSNPEVRIGAMPEVGLEMLIEQTITKVMESFYEELENYRRTMPHR